MTTLTGLQLCLRPCVMLTLDLLHPTCCDTMGITVMRSCQTVLEIFRQKVFVTYFNIT